MSTQEEIPAPPDLIEEESEAEDGKKKGTDSREYHVFQEGNTNQWIHVGSHVATNADGAIKALGESLKEGARYAACPSRNWTVGKPKVKVETTVTLEFE